MASETEACRILLFGSDGQVGFELGRCLKSLGEIVAPDRSEADFAEPESLRDVVRRTTPDVIVNAAAYTAVDKAESEPELATEINAASPTVLAEEADAIGACLVHYSTDYVFDGRHSSEYVEDSPVNPQSVYGRSKLGGEQGVLETCRRSLVFRTSWVFGAQGHNFLKTMLKLGAERESLSVVSDQVGVPTSAPIIADTTTLVLSKMIAADDADDRWGLYHLVAAGQTSWHGFATYALEKAAALGYRLALNPSDIRAIATAEYPTAATRPANSVLNTRKIQATFGLAFPDWRMGVDQVLEQLVR